MRLKCPVCDTINTFAGDDATVCRHCGFSGDVIDDETGHQAAVRQVSHAPPPPGATSPPQQEVGDPRQQVVAPQSAATAGSAYRGDTRQVDPFSIAALVTGIVGIVIGWAFMFILPLAAVVLGIIGITRTGAQDPQRGRGYAVAGLILGVVGILLAFLWMFLMMLFGFGTMWRFGGGPWWWT